MITVSTSNFISLSCAEEYYSSKETVQTKLDEGLISIGKPAINSSDTLDVDSDGRYIIKVVES